MKSKITDIVTKIDELKKSLRLELNREHEKFKEKYGFIIKKGRVVFDKKIRIDHKKFRENVFKYIFCARIRNLLSAPFIYSMIIPTILLDFFITIFHHVCFWLYGIPKVKRSDYIIFDKRFLSYLNIIQKAHCIYCSYVNGLFAYAREIAGRTEKYWCPIKHSQSNMEGLHKYYGEFADYGDPKGFKEISKYGKKGK